MSRYHGNQWKTGDAVLRFWSHVDKSSECWLWTGSKNAAGYGRFSFHLPGSASATGAALAHRVSYHLFVGPIPAEKLVLHICDTPACVRPDHLRLGSAAENARDMVVRGRSTKGKSIPHIGRSGDEHWSHRRPEAVMRGEKHPQSKITDEQVRMMRRLHEEKQVSITELASLLSLSAPYVAAVLSGRYRRSASD